MLRAVVPPLVAAYAVFVGMVLVAGRRPVPRPGGRHVPARRGNVVGTTLGGYVAFLAIVLVFHVWLAGERDAFASAVWGGGFLASIALAVSAASATIARRNARRR